MATVAPKEWILGWISPALKKRFVATFVVMVPVSHIGCESIYPLL